METAYALKIPCFERRRYQSSTRGTGCPAKEPERHILPGIGSFVIDTPKDKHFSARERSQRYRESHRGILRAQIESLPDIPKRYPRRSLPIVKFKDVSEGGPGVDGSPTPCGEHDAAGPWPDGSIDHLETKYRELAKASALLLRKKEVLAKVPTQEELVSRSPLGRIVQEAAAGRARKVSCTGFGVRKGKAPQTELEKKAYRYTPNLSMNMSLANPEQTLHRATDRELESQAEYRRQLTFCMSGFLEDGRGNNIHTAGGGGGGDGGDEIVVMDADDNNPDKGRSVVIKIPRDNIGHTSKHISWANYSRLREMLIANATPDIRRRLTASTTTTTTTNTTTTTTTTASSTAGLRSVRESGIRTKRRHGERLQIPAANSYFISPAALQGRGSRKGIHFAGRSHNFDNVHDTDDDSGSDNDDDDDDDDGHDEDGFGYDKAWMEAVNTPVVDAAVYDRYANVKIPSYKFEARPRPR